MQRADLIFSGFLTSCPLSSHLFSLVFFGSYEFFADAGTVADVRIAMDEDGRSRGFGHVEFETSEGAQNALSKSGQSVEGREIFVDLARERGAAPPSGGKEWGAT